MVIDCDNKEQFKYIHSIIKCNRDPVRLADGTVLYSSMIQANPQQAILSYAQSSKYDYNPLNLWFLTYFWRIIMGFSKIHFIV